MSRQLSFCIGRCVLWFLSLEQVKKTWGVKLLVSSSACNWQYLQVLLGWPHLEKVES